MQIVTVRKIRSWNLQVLRYGVASLQRAPARVAVDRLGTVSVDTVHRQPVVVQPHHPPAGQAQLDHGVQRHLTDKVQLDQVQAEQSDLNVRNLWARHPQQKS